MSHEEDSALTSSGIKPFDESHGGLERGGSYLVVGPPGPAKMVSILQFLHAGLEHGEMAVMVTNAEEASLLGVARAWGFDLEPWWRDGSLQLIGFREEFELRALRSVEPEDVLEELGWLVEGDPRRIGVDPGSLLLSGGVRSRLGAAYLRWARDHPATVCTTLAVDAATPVLPSSIDWVIHATTGQLLLESLGNDLYQLSLQTVLPESGEPRDAVSLELRPGAGLVRPTRSPGRRRLDRTGVDENRLLLISLVEPDGSDVAAWARATHDVDIVSEPFEAVARVQGDPSFGGVLVHAPRTRIREAVTACRALRPLTRAAIVFATDDAIRSSDRVALLEAGADDCLSGGVDVRELDLRMHQSISSGARAQPAAAEPSDSEPGGSVSIEEFAAEFDRRADHPTLSFFCVMEAIAERIEVDTLADILLDQVRVDDGDLVARDGRRCLVLLQGAREGRLSGFLERLGRRLEGEVGLPLDAAVRFDVLSHPSQSDGIRSVLGR